MLPIAPLPITRASSISAAAATTTAAGSRRATSTRIAICIRVESAAGCRPIPARATSPRRKVGSRVEVAATGIEVIVAVKETSVSVSNSVVYRRKCDFGGCGAKCEVEVN
jgi:hypothetical protein